MSINACAGMVKKSDPDRFYSAMTARPEQRGALMVLYAFNLEVARAPWVTQEEMIAEMRLQWWKDAIAEIYEGRAPRQHEVVAPLADVITTHDLPRGLFDELIEARRFDIYQDPHTDWQAFEAYFKATSGNLICLAALTLGVNKRELNVVSDFGSSAGIANLIRALPMLYAAKRKPFPIGDTTESLLRAVNLGMTGLADARQHRKTITIAALPALLAGFQADMIFAAAKADPALALTVSWDSSEFSRRWNLLWRSFTGKW